MFDVCWDCGSWTPAKRILDDTVVCPDCGHGHPFRSLPLLVLTGASGAGKSTTLQAYVRQLVTEGEDPPVVPLESDVLWGVGADMASSAYFDLWQRVCVNVHQAGRPVLLVGAGMHPGNMESALHPQVPNVEIYKPPTVK